MFANGGNKKCAGFETPALSTVTNVLLGLQAFNYSLKPAYFLLRVIKRFLLWKNGKDNK